MRAALGVSHLSFRYPDGHEALRDVSFQVEAGSSVAVLGPNGAGKSTLFLHFNGLLKGSGSVRIFGQEVNGAHLKEIRQKVGLVFQNPDDQLFMPSVFEDVAFGPVNLGFSEIEVRERVRRALAAVGMVGRETADPHHLSAGEKKRVAIATVLAMDPGILALDEPSSHLDPRHRRELIQLLRRLPQTQLIATHDLDLVGQVCHRAILLDGGRIVAQGSARELLRNQALLEAHGL